MRMINLVNLTNIIFKSVDQLVRLIDSTVRLIEFEVVEVKYNVHFGPSAWEILLPKVPANPT